MRLKSIPMWEQHLEKIVLGALLVILLGVIVWQFISNPNVVEVRVDGRTQMLTPTEINGELLRYAKQVRERQEPDAPPMAVPPSIDKVQLVAEDMDTMITGNVARSKQLPRISPRVAAAIMPSGKRDGALFHAPSLPALAMLPRVQQFSDELTETSMENYPELASFVREPGSREIDWTIPVGRIQMRATRDEFDASDADHDAIPAYWRDDTYAIVDVVFEREHQKADGSWSERETVPAVIDTLTFREELATFTSSVQSLGQDQADDARLELRESLLDTLSNPQLQTEIAHPLFYETEWAAADRYMLDPDGHASNSRDADTIKLETQYLRQRSRVERVRGELDELGGPLDPADGAKQGDGDGERGGRKGRGGGGAPPGGGGMLGGSKQAGDDSKSASDAEKEAERKRRMNKTVQLRSLERQLQALRERLETDAPQSELLGGNTGSSDGLLVDVKNDETILAWTHDPTVQAGETYRYRCVAMFYNPFFTREFQLESEQRELASSPTIESAMSEWSDPVTITSGISFFVTEAAAPSRDQLGEATVEVFRLQDGRYWSETYTVGPGDRIGAVKRKAGREPVDFTTEWYVVDIVATGGPGESGSAGTEVVLQRIGETSSELAYKNPAVDGASEDFTRLDSEVRFANARGDNASSAGNAPGRGRGPGGGSGPGGTRGGGSSEGH